MPSALRGADFARKGGFMLEKPKDVFLDNGTHFLETELIDTLA
jgi:hypothetical protein